MLSMWPWFHLISSLQTKIAVNHSMADSHMMRNFSGCRNSHESEIEFRV